MSEFDLSTAERLDRAVDGIVLGRPAGPAAATAGAGADLMPLIDAAGALRAALEPPLASPRFETRLAARLAEASLLQRGVNAVRHPNRMLVTGAAVSSAAVGVGITAWAVWRSTRRQSTGHRLLER